MNKITSEVPVSHGNFYPQNEQPGQYLHSNKIYTTPKTQVVLGLDIENYSDFDLRNASLVYIDDCRATKYLKKSNNSDVLANSKAMFFFDNDNWTHRGLCGAISWLVLKKNQNLFSAKRKDTRFLVTFRVPYK